MCCRRNATGGSYYSPRWRCAATDAQSESVRHTAATTTAAAADPTATDIIRSPDPDTIPTHSICSAAGRLNALLMTGFLQVRENWKKSENLCGQRFVGGKYHF